MQLRDVGVLALVVDLSDSPLPRTRPSLRRLEGDARDQVRDDRVR
jgi:hypothetical protein